jgi:PP-loop superfamily ATP-utilizing enzyme
VRFEDLERFFKEDVFRQAVCHELRRLGFQRVTIDLEGFCSGSLYQLTKPSL